MSVGRRTLCRGGVVLTVALLSAGRVFSSLFDENRILPVSGNVLGADSCAEIEVQSSGMRTGAKCVYVTPAQDGHFAQTVKLFPGQNLVTARSSSGTTEKYVPLSVERPTLRVELNYPGPSENDCYWLEFSYNGEVYGIPPGTDIWAWGDYSAHQGFVFEHAAAGRYGVSVFHSVEQTIPPPVTTTVRIYVNDELVYTANNGNGIDTWSVGTFILHSGESVGGYAVDESSRLDVAGQGEIAGFDRIGYGALSVTHLEGPNGSASVYLKVGDAAQFTAEGVLLGLVCGGEQYTQIIEGFSSSDTSVGDIDALGVFVAKATGHTQVSCQGYGGDPIDVYVVSVDIVPDWDHDRQITASDANQARSTKPFRFWKNDDDDFGDISEEDSDNPGQSGLLDNANCDDDEVNGRSDLLDFFPVRLDLHDILNFLPPSGTVQYKLKQADEAVRAVYTDLTTGAAGDFLTAEGNTYGPSFNQNSYEADTFEVTSSGESLSAAFLDKVKNDSNKGILLIEGKNTSAAPLVLEIWKDGVKIFERKMPLSIDGVENFYRWINRRGVAGGGVDRDTDTSEPANYPDSYCNGKQFIFVHGYSVHEEAARAWNAEMFKRLYQSGSRAMFTAVTWRGNDGQLWDWIPFVGGSTPDYYVNVEHAFETASNLVSILDANVPGTKYIAGHSLGNMVVSSAIVDHGLSVSAYFMLNAAVAMKAYNASFDNRNDMRHPDWQNYDSRLWASEWYQLFTSGDGRNTLRWGDRFGTMSSAFNYYSETEDVLNNANGSVPTIGNERAWVNQEMRKGTTLMWIAPGNQEGGWGFNDDYEDLTVAEANALPDCTVQTNSFFGRFDNENLYGTNGSAIAQQPATYRQLLADAIPALSNPAGRNSLDSAVGQGNRDFMTHDGGTGFRRGLWENGDWPQQDNRWRHSDLKRIAYPYNSKAFDQIVSDGSLK